MWARIIFCTSVLLAILVVVLLALFSTTPSHNILSKNDHTRPPWLSLSLYIQQPPHIGGSAHSTALQPITVQSEDAGALVFHRSLTEGPENTSLVVGKAQGFIIPVEHFAHSDFNILYLSFDTPEYSGSLSVEANHITHKDTEELAVVGGTGSFAFAKTTISSDADYDATYHVKLQLTFPNQSRTIPG